MAETIQLALENSMPPFTETGFGATAQVSKAALQEKLSVLFVDDEHHLLDSFAAQFKKQFTVHTAEDITTAKNLLQRTRMDVVVSDLRMPGGTGMELLAWIKSHCPDIGRILLTGHADVEIAMQAVNDINIFRFLTKPCSMNDLAEAIIQAGIATKEKSTLNSLSEAEQCRSIMAGVVQSFNHLVEQRDPYTAAHQHRVAELSRKIGEQMGLEDCRLNNLEFAALVHDIGKALVPLAYLNKSGPLCDVEFSVIQKHPVCGYEMLCKTSQMEPVAQIVLQHHERMDGSGYPQGLSGNQILPEARILAVADTIDAMTSHRPYRASLGSQAVKDELHAGKGTLFDEKIVQATLKTIS